MYDGSGGPGRRADVGIRGDRIVAVGRIEGGARTVVDARGLAVAPGFVNMLSWAPVTLLEDGRSQSDIRQGVTTEIFGEGTSMGPINDAMRRRMIASQTDIKYDVPWTTLAEYLRHLERRGVSPNVASFIGAATIRAHVLGLDDVKPTPAQMNEMRELVRGEMEAGALGIGTALIYAPGTYATTEELIELCKVAARYKGTYISHMRSESDKLVEGVEELIRISREAGLPAEIHHFKVVGQKNWDRLDQAIAAVERARAPGPPDHREHVPLHRELDGPERDHPDVGPRRRGRRPLRPAAGPRHAGADRRRDARPRAHVPHALRRASAPRRCGLSSARPSRRSRGRAGRTRSTRRSTSCSRTAPGSAPSSSR